MKHCRVRHLLPPLPCGDQSKRKIESVCERHIESERERKRERPAASTAAASLRSVTATNRIVRFAGIGDFINLQPGGALFLMKEATLYRVYLRTGTGTPWMAYSPGAGPTVQGYERGHVQINPSTSLFGSRHQPCRCDKSDCTVEAGITNRIVRAILGL